jgi:hypothetical protein
MKNDVPSCLTEGHLTLFGAIIGWFAQHEVLMQGLMAKVAGADEASIALLTRSLGFDEKRTALLDLLRHREIPLDQFDRIAEFLMVAHTLSPLHHDIAHRAWKRSRVVGWIQPDWIVHRPERVAPRLPGHCVEREEDKLGFSVDELADIAETLAENHRAFSRYLESVGLTDGREETVRSSP